MTNAFVVLLCLLVGFAMVESYPKQVVYYPSTFSYQEDIHMDETRRFPAECTLDKLECFDLKRCAGKPLTIFSYLPVADLIQVSNHSQWHILLKVLEPYLVYTKPDEACVLLPPVNTLILAWNLVFFERFQTIVSDKTWKEGRQHIIFNFEDQDVSFFLPPNQTHLGYSLLLSSSAMASYRIRSRYDLALPLVQFNTQNQTLLLKGLGEFVHRPTVPPHTTKERKWLFSFKGTRYPHIATIRNILAMEKQIFNTTNSMVLTHCAPLDDPYMGLNDHFYRTKTDCEYSDKTFSDEDYEILLKESTFVLCPRGFGRHSYRLMEAMVFGAIPVILSDSFALPFSPELDFAKCAIVWPENLVRDLPHFLEGMRNQERHDRLRACAEFVRYMFQTNHIQYSQNNNDLTLPFEAVIVTAIDVLKKRVFAL